MGSGGRAGGSTADSRFVAPKKNLPVNCAALLAARCSSMRPVLDVGSVMGLVSLMVTFRLDPVLVCVLVAAIAFATLMSWLMLCCSIVIGGMHLGSGCGKDRVVESGFGVVVVVYLTGCVDV